jgi:hypothetical protein
MATSAVFFSSLLFLHHSRKRTLYFRLQLHSHRPFTTMDIGTPSSQGSIDSPSSANPSRAAVFKGAAPSTGRAEDSLLRTILDKHGREMLNFASSQFLDHAMALRLRTIAAKDLVSMLAKAERLGYSETDVISETDDETDQAVHETHGRDDPVSMRLVP